MAQTASDGRSPVEQEEFRTQLLEEIGRKDDTEEERASHQRFLQARADAAAKAAGPPETHKAAAPSKPPPVPEALRVSQQLRVGGQAYDEDTGRRLQGLGQSQDRAKHVEFLEAKREGQAAAAVEEEARASLAAVTQQLSSEPKATQIIPNWVPPEMYKEWGYPELDPKFKDREWHKKQLQLDSTDPRHNPNLKRDQNDPEFWYHAARKPFSKAVLRTEQHWEGRRRVWLKQFEQVKDANQRRELLGELLEECPNEVKRLVCPIMHYSITTAVLANIVDKAREEDKSFEEVLLEEESLETLRGIRTQIEVGGEKAAVTMMTEYDARFRLLADRLGDKALEQEEKRERQVADIQTLASIINWATKCKKDGLLEWEQGNWAEAQASWRQADETLRKFKAADKENTALLFELHASVLKNLSQVCIKLGSWNEAAKAAQSAVELSPEDHKAWFRKACALEGLGKFVEAEACLLKIDECSVGRPDRLRIAKDTQAKREKLQALREREQASLKKALEKALEKGVFSEERHAIEIQEERHAIEAGPCQPSSSSSAQASLPRSGAEEETKKRPKPQGGGGGQFQNATRKLLTRDGAEDLLLALRDAYRDSTFQAQVMKLARDVHGEKRAFLANLKQVALPLQRPILEKFGFEPGERGVMEMTRAIQDFTRGPRADEAVKARADETTIALYGVMYDILTRPDEPGEAELRIPVEVRLGAQKQMDDDD
eukprot:CAMPEP_0115161272 /NCGR_PEP_ID=MMETSP0227-20121206/71253_1 /TAXON_ID=89957 /ORGANISM="Polarella glacialis, Strain CCMP 1383" /LENGTH=717 /DNA_ID=CAMNT_0002573231 /DNA_START=46 /DNA_END=2200 /DNA_ORIENTATION=+